MNIVQDTQIGKPRKLRATWFERRVRNYLTKEGYEVFKPKEHTYDLRLNIEVPFYGTLALTAEVKTTKWRSTPATWRCKPTTTGDPPAYIQKDLTQTYGFTASVTKFIIRTSILQSLCQTYTTSWGADTVKMGNPESKASGSSCPFPVAKKVKGGRWVKL